MKTRGEVQALLLIAYLLQGLFVGSASAATATVATGKTPLEVGTIVDVLEDAGGKMTIGDVTKPANARRFVSLAGHDPHLGFTRSAWWGRFTLTNPSDVAVTQIIELTHPVIDRIEFFRPGQAPGTFRVNIAGDSVVDRDVDIRGPNPSFSVRIPPETSETFYLRLSGESTLSFRGRVWSAPGYINQLNNNININFIFFGVLVAAALASLAIFIVDREESYFLFAIGVMAVGVYQGESRGYISANLWPHSTWISNFLVLFAAAVTLCAMLRFTAKFLRLSHNAPRADALFLGLQAIGVTAAALSFFDYQAAARMLVLGLALGNLTAFAVAAFLWFKGVAYARMFTIFWGVLCGIVILSGAEKLGFVTIGEGVDFGLRVFVSLTVIMFAVLFSDRYRFIYQMREQKHKIARDEAVAASKAKSKFLATMSHELRTPLNAVIGFSDILSQETPKSLGTDKYREYALDIKNSGSHLLKIINDLLELSRIEADQVELDEHTIVLPDLLRRCVKIVGAAAKDKEIALKMRITEPLPYLHGDETRLQQVVINLLYNAIKFTPKGGEVTLGAEKNTSGELRITVSDTGIGIAEGDLEKVLEPFSQIAPHLTREHGGLGLGLAITRSIVALHGGHLAVASAVGEGTTFSVIFPKERTIDG